MTTSTHSHKAWTGKGAHVSAIRDLSGRPISDGAEDGGDVHLQKEVAKG